MGDDRPFRRVVVIPSVAGRRADVFLATWFTDWSRTKLAQYIRDGFVESERRTLKPSSTLQAGEVLRVYVPGIAPVGAPPPLPPIIYEDEWLMALNKPPGMLTHPSGQRWEYGIIGLARAERPGLPMALAHRIDRDTSGVLVLTKNVDADRKLKLYFKERKVHKTYHAIVRGVVPWEEQMVDGPIGIAGRKLELRRAVVEGGDPAKTRVKVLRRMEGYTLVGCKPVTGRTHQIRVHLEHVGHPILGDKIYGQPDEVFLEYMDLGPSAAVRAAVGFPRQCLHARAIRFPHPITGAPLKIVAPLPDDMRAIVKGAAPKWETT